MIRNLTTYTPDFSVIDTSLDSSNSKGRVPQDFLEKHSIISTPSKASKREESITCQRNPNNFPKNWNITKVFISCHRSLTQLYFVESIQFWQLCHFGQKSGRAAIAASWVRPLLFGLGEEGKQQVFFVFPPLHVKMRSSDGQLGLGKAAVHGS